MSGRSLNESSKTKIKEKSEFNVQKFIVFNKLVKEDAFEEFIK